MCLFSGQTKCDPCPLNTFAMMGASKCIPLPKCTKDDIISAPGKLSTCSCNNTGVCTTKVQERLVTVAFKGELTYITPLGGLFILSPFEGGLIEMAGLLRGAYLI